MSGACLSVKLSREPLDKFQQIIVGYTFKLMNFGVQFNTNAAVH